MMCRNTPTKVYPKEKTTVPYDEAIERVTNGYYGDDIRNEYEKEDPTSIKRILFFAGREFPNNKKACETMLHLVLLCEGRLHDRFQFLLSKSCDRDLSNQMIGAETNEETYTNNGRASGKTYKQCYGEHLVAIQRYVQQTGAFGCLPKEEMEELVFFFRVNLFGTCYLAAVCILASYLGQMAFKFKRVPCPPDVYQMIRSFNDVDLCDYIIKDHGGDAIQRLCDMLERLGNPNPRLATNIPDSLSEQSFNLGEKLENLGPGLVTNFLCTRAFHQAWELNPAWQSTGRKDMVTVGLIQFDMQDSQDFKSVQGKFIELKALRGTNTIIEDEINSRLEAAAKKLEAKSLWFEPSPNKTKIGSTNVGRGGDRSAHIYSPQSPPDSIQSSRHDRTSIGHEIFDLDENRDLGNESMESLRDGERRQLEIRDRPPMVEHDETDESGSFHAMVCIGGRIDQQSRKTFLLLQNSWSRMPLVEVSLNYLIAAGASLSFVGKRDRELFKGLVEKDCFYQVNTALVADCSNASYCGPGL